MPADPERRWTGQLIDAVGKTVTPGLIDPHVHLQFDGTDETTYDTDPVPADILALRAYKHALANLRAGITTVRDLGAGGHALITLRDQIREGSLVGPDILTCGRAVTSTGGHGWNISVEANGAQAVRDAVRREMKAGADCIKLFVTGFPGQEPEGYAGRHLQRDEIVEAVEEAHQRGRKVAVHACNEASVVTAVEAGADSIEHGINLTDVTLELLAVTGTALNPTLAYLSEATGSTLGDESTYSEETKQSIDTIRRAMAAGVTVLPGSDSGCIKPGALGKEFEALRHTGMTDAQILESATTVSAAFLELSDRGRIAPGALADIVIWNTDWFGPADTVIRAGSVVYRAGSSEQAAGG
jgi:imidazolonepropionase-like amidohydrolase